MYIVTRPLGASIADWLGKPYLGGLGLGDDKVALAMIAAFIALVAVVAARRVDAPTAGAASA